VNPFQDLFDAQKALFATGVTRTYDWRVDQLDRMARMIGENEHRFQKPIAHDFKTASLQYIMETASSIDEAALQKDNVKEWMEPVEAPVPRSLRASGHKAFVHREPYVVALIMGPFNGPLTPMIRPGLDALAAERGHRVRARQGVPLHRGRRRPAGRSRFQPRHDTARHPSAQQGDPGRAAARSRAGGARTIPAPRNAAVVGKPRCDNTPPSWLARSTARTQHLGAQADPAPGATCMASTTEKRELGEQVVVGPDGLRDDLSVGQ
jgi:hypothetical protein